MQASRRAHRGRDGWAALMERWRSSGLSVEAFCRIEGVNRSGYYRWRIRRIESNKWVAGFGLKPVVGLCTEQLLEITESAHIKLVDWTGRLLHPGKTGKSAHGMPLVLSTMGVSERRWEGSLDRNHLLARHWQRRLAVQTRRGTRPAVVARHTRRYCARTAWIAANSFASKLIRRRWTGGNGKQTPIATSPTDIERGSDSFTHQRPVRGSFNSPTALSWRGSLVSASTR